MPTYTVHFFPLSMFSYLDPGLTNFTEIATGKVGQQLTVGDSITYQSFEVYDSDPVFDDLAGSDQKLVSGITIDGVSYGAGLTADTGYGIEIDSNGDGYADTTLALLKINGQPVGFIEAPFGAEPVAALQPNTTYTVINGGGTRNTADVFYEDMAYCFAADALIETRDGPVPAGRVAVGDRVLTRDHGARPVRWVGQRHYSAADLARAPHLRPIRIRAGALGGGLPLRDLVVSPQHRVLVRSAIAQKMFGTSEVLIAAKHLCLLDGIDIAGDLTGVTYVHFMFDRHQVVFAEGAEAESLFTGPEALKAVGPAARAEILTIFPELAVPGHQAEPARPIPSGRLGRKLAIRHLRNRKPLVAMPV